jgi:6-phosphogluconolactonase
MEGEGVGGTGGLPLAAKKYDSILRRELPAADSGFPALDLVLLGLGDDGHVASLFPGTAALAETQAVAVANEVPQHDTWRLTLTFPTINAARAVWMTVSGSSKAERVAEALGYRPGGEALPVWRVKPAGGAPLWRLDPSAARLLPVPPAD